MADVAQLVEPRIVIPVVAGSIPVIRPIFFRFLSTSETPCSHTLKSLFPQFFRLYFYEQCFKRATEF